MKREELYFHARVKIWNEKLEEYEFGEVISEDTFPGFVRVCLDDEIAPYMVFPVSNIELVKQ